LDYEADFYSESESVKERDKRTTAIYKTLHRKPKLEHHEPH